MGSIEIRGRLATRGDQVTTLEVHGKVGHLGVAGGIHAAGMGSEAVVASRPVPGLDAVRVMKATALP